MQAATQTRPFDLLRGAMRRYVDNDILAGVSWSLLRGRDEIDRQFVGYADRDATTPLRKTTSSEPFPIQAVHDLRHHAARRGRADRPRRQDRKFLPQLGNRKVLKADATSLADVEPARSSITIRHLLSHSSGLSYRIFDPGTLIFKACNEAKIMNPETPLSDMVDRLADLPLTYHPGASFRIFDRHRRAVARRRSRLRASPSTNSCRPASSRRSA